MKCYAHKIMTLLIATKASEHTTVLGSFSEATKELFTQHISLRGLMMKMLNKYNQFTIKAKERFKNQLSASKQNIGGAL